MAKAIPSTARDRRRGGAGARRARPGRVPVPAAVRGRAVVTVPGSRRRPRSGDDAVRYRLTGAGRVRPAGSAPRELLWRHRELRPRGLDVVPDPGLVVERGWPTDRRGEQTER